jgi:hypothetical protein
MLVHYETLTNEILRELCFLVYNQVQGLNNEGQ